MSAERTKTKITMTIWDDLFNHFSKRLDSCFIKRDAFLNHAIRVEIDHLTRGLVGLKNSPEAKKYISSTLKRMSTTTVNVVVDKDVSEALNRVVKEHNLARDAFMNRLMLLLCFPDNLLSQLFELRLTQVIEGDNCNYVELDPPPRAFSSAIEFMQGSPNHYIHEELDICYQSNQGNLDSNLYTREIRALPKDCFAYIQDERTRNFLRQLNDSRVVFSCYLEDSVDVPNTEAWKQHKDFMDELDKLDLSGLFPRNKNEHE